jgi:hypothetical protein
VHPVVIGDFVIVPDADERGAGVCGLHVAVALHLRVAHPVVGEADDLMARLDQATDLAGDFGPIPFRAIFVDIVAEMHDGVEPVELGDRIIGVEQSAAVELA